jgi:hypothetical protein
LNAERKAQDGDRALQAAQQELKESVAREAAEALKRERLVCERDAAGNRTRTLENEAIDARRRIGERDEKLIFHLLIHPSIDSSVTLHSQIARSKCTFSGVIHSRSHSFGTCPPHIILFFVFRFFKNVSTTNQ